jgi:hypothetical protein
MNIGNMVPLQVNLVDYCTDNILFSTYFAVEMDKFTMVNIPCAYQPIACNLLPPEEYSACLEGQQVWSEVFGCPKVSNSTSSNNNFYQREIGSRICSSANYCEVFPRSETGYPANCSKRTDLLWTDRPKIDPTSPLMESVGFCSCNWKQAQQRANGTNVTKGVMDGFIKEGMSTFYVQVRPYSLAVRISLFLNDTHSMPFFPPSTLNLL